MAFNWKPPPNAGQAGAVPKTNTIQCKSCGGTDFDDFCESGDRACALCGTVLQENGIVSTIQFSESGGSSNVVGQFVSGDKGRPSGGGAGGRGRGRFGHSRDSRETTIQNGKKKILQARACVYHVCVLVIYRRSFTCRRCSIAWTCVLLSVVPTLPGDSEPGGGGFSSTTPGPVAPETLQTVILEKVVAIILPPMYLMCKGRYGAACCRVQYQKSAERIHYSALWTLNFKVTASNTETFGTGSSAVNLHS